MAKKYSCNPKIKKFNKSVIRDKSPAAKRSQAAHKKGMVKGAVSKMDRR